MDTRGLKVAQNLKRLLEEKRWLVTYQIVSFRSIAMISSLFIIVGTA